jgi:cell division protease FtsH
MSSSSPTRRILPQKSDLSHPDLEFEPEVVEGRGSRRPRDPAVAAARLLLDRAQSNANTSTAEAARDGAVCVVVAPAAWIETTLEAWKYTARDGQRYEDGRAGRSYGDALWYAWSATERPSKPQNDTESFASALWRGRHVFAVTSNLDWLPADLVAAADHRFALPQLTGADVDILVRKVCSGGVLAEGAFSDADAADLSPTLLRLARRPDQSPDDYVKKLTDVLGRYRAAQSLVVVPPPVAISPRSSPNLDRLHGMGEAVAWGQALAIDLAAYRAGEISWASVDGGCLLSGPPGTGKTLFARALAETCGIPLVTGSYASWLGSGNAHQGDLMRSMRKTFAEALEKAPSVLFIDEIDSFPDRATIKHEWADWEIQVVNALLAEIDGAGGRDGVIVVGACNFPEKLDAALTRSGRLDRHIRIKLPDGAALSKILREHLADDLAEQDLSNIALLAAGSSGADCERFVRGARRRARVAGRPMQISDLRSELFDGNDASEEDQWIAAVHEAGHAVAACVQRRDTLHAVSLRGSSSSGGRTVMSSHRRYPSASDLHTSVILLLAGRAAEQILIGRPSTGSGGGQDSDLARATELSATAVAAHGFDENVGLAWCGDPDPRTLPEMLREPLLAASVGAALDRAMADALDLVRKNQQAVQAVAETLLLRHALDGNEIAEIVRRCLVAASTERSS